MRIPSIKIIDSEADKHQYYIYLLSDIQAFEQMLANNEFETGV
ncbi:MAG: hypothetical protein AAF632_03005 [Bacteroidota bacterium]